MRSLKSFLFAAAILAAATQARASFIDANVYGGYATFAMAEADKSLKDLGASLTLTVESGITSGYYVGGDVAITLMPFLKVGPRVEFLQTNTSKLKAGSLSTTWNASLTPFMLGISTDWTLPLTDFGVRAGVWAGYGLAKLNLGSEGVTPPVTNSGSGAGFVAQIAADARYSFFPFLSLELNLGYRLANISEMKWDKTDSIGITGQSIYKYGTTNALPFDFSGLNVGGGLNFNF